MRKSAEQEETSLVKSPLNKMTPQKEMEMEAIFDVKTLTKNAVRDICDSAK